MNPSPTVECLLTFSQAAAMIGISLRQFRRLTGSGKIPVVKVSARAPRIRPMDIQHYLDSVTVTYSKP